MSLLSFNHHKLSKLKENLARIEHHMSEGNIWYTLSAIDQMRSELHKFEEQIRLQRKRGQHDK